MLTHQGRRSGRVYHTVLEAIRYDRTTGEIIVVSAYGENADWYRNIQVTQPLHIHIGRRRFVPVQRFLTQEETYAELADYERRHPTTARFLIRMLGIDYDGSESERRALAAFFRMVSFRPRAHAGTA
ncbi:MAG: nitroreductase family deazaflavin-dependent oxidoreductase [Thermoplasmata archaeon]